jgi:hypothetical protein
MLHGTNCMTFLGLVTAIVRTGNGNFFSDSVFDLKLRPGYGFDTLFISARRGFGDRDTVAQIDAEVWYPCGAQDATHHTRTATSAKVAPNSITGTFEKMAMPLGAHNVSVSMANTPTFRL